MASIQRTAQADEDLIELWLYIAQDSPTAADRVLDDIEESFQHLSKNPLMGRVRPDIAPELRYFASGRYLILYRTISNGIQIVRVIHGARDWQNLF